MRAQAQGIVQDTGRALRVKATLDGESAAQLTLCFEGGGRRTIDFAPDGAEREWALDAPQTPLCAYVAVRGALRLFTDEEAKRAYLADAARREAKTKRPRETQRAAEEKHDAPQRQAARSGRDGAQRAEPAAAPEPCDGSGRAKEAERAAREAAADGEARQREGLKMPQRRWPPPPCMPSARYAAGEWTPLPGKAERVTPSAR